MSAQESKGECPFSGHDESMVNVKFFRGRRDDIITPEEIREQFRSAKIQHAQKAAIISNRAPVSDHPVIDVRDLVASL